MTSVLGQVRAGPICFAALLITKVFEGKLLKFLSTETSPNKGDDGIEVDELTDSPSISLRRR